MAPPIPHLLKYLVRLSGLQSCHAWKSNKQFSHHLRVIAGVLPP
jgi:hypothetical protein